ncbi:MAG: PilZ domain-containing protein [Nitrospira sp.]|nr:PilZ domain-containing protein [Nitrospira sp.]
MTHPSYRRTYLRYPMRYPVIFGWESCVGEGLLTNLSFNGCSVLCHRTPSVGMDLKVSLLLPDLSKALSIEGGTIKWAEDQLFGVEFHPLPLHTRQRLNRTLRLALIHRLQAHSSQPDHSVIQGIVPRHLPI